MATKGKNLQLNNNN